ncbi:MAG: transcriptional repressor [Acidobacteriia bacterium]|jgi:Fur family ferric uptake transcriptional regulator|nr:transcriptional repressor [Terriglobia bacterium]
MRLSLTSKKWRRLPRRTRERELILDRLPTLPGHFSADDVVYALRRHGVSRATVYRTLDLLVEQGFLQRVHLDAGGARYEIIHNRAPHAHLYCLGCGRLSDYPLPLLLHLPEQVRRKQGFAAEHLLFRICGYCRACRARLRRQQRRPKPSKRTAKS